MKPRHNIARQRFGRLRAIAPTHIGSRVLWKCICDCGKQCVVRADKLLRGKWKSCGCLRKEGGGEWLRRNKTSQTHGLSKTSEYNSLKHAIARCRPGNKNSVNYFDRGIWVCKKWADISNGFLDFLAHIGPRPRGCSLDRINNDGNYEPGNVKWSTRKEQNSNQRKRARIEKFSDSEWSADGFRRGYVVKRLGL